ncbi:MAG: hypothetical protein WCL70_05730 [Paludibacter sp.]
MNEEEIEERKSKSSIEREYLDCYQIQDNVYWLIIKVAMDKAEVLDDRAFNLAEYLPKSLKDENLKNAILNTNQEIIKRDLIRPNTESTNDPIFILDLIVYNSYPVDLEKDELFVQYSKFKKNEEEIMDIYKNYSSEDISEFLPFFHELTDDLALLIHFDNIVSFYETEEQKRETKKPKTIHQLHTKLTDKQRLILYELLIKNGFIPETTNKEGFIWAFGSKNSTQNSFSTKWLKASNLAAYFIDKLCYDPVESTHFWAIGERIFSNIKFMRKSKQIYLGNKNGKPKGYEIIDKIIAEARK